VLPRTASGGGHERRLRAVQRRADPARGRLHLQGGLCRAQLLLQLDVAPPLRPQPQPHLLRAARRLPPQGRRDLPAHRKHHHRIQPRKWLISSLSTGFLYFFGLSKWLGGSGGACVVRACGNVEVGMRISWQ
jgi:hypothetical protein